jgi:hypothetical protein
LASITNGSIPFGEMCEVSQGLIPYDKYRGHDEATIRDRVFHASHRKDATYRKELRGADVTRYSVAWNGKQWISYGPWLAAPRRPEFFRSPRLLFREITDPRSGTLNVAFTDDEFYNNPGIINCIARPASPPLHLLLAIANSAVVGYWHLHTSPKARKGLFPKILVADVRRLPIPSSVRDGTRNQTRLTALAGLARRMTELHESWNCAQTDRERIAFKRYIDATDREIDQLVYELYGLTDDEIRIVEEATASQ